MGLVGWDRWAFARAKREPSPPSVRGLSVPRANASLLDHLQRRLGQMEPREIAALRPRCVGCVGCTAESAARRTAQIVNQHVVITHAAVGIDADTIEHVDHRADFDVETGLFAHLARDRGLERFADFDSTSRQTPLALQRFVAATDEQHAVAVENPRADTDDGPLWVFAHVASGTGLGAGGQGP